MTILGFAAIGGWMTRNIPLIGSWGGIAVGSSAANAINNATNSTHND
jgi:hypothetical protein